MHDLEVQEKSTYLGQIFKKKKNFCCPWMQYKWKTGGLHYSIIVAASNEELKGETACSK